MAFSNAETLPLKRALQSLEDAVDELTACLAELWDLTRGTTAPQSD